MLIEAGQHIYGNVEKELSPNKVGGFQTLFYTREVLTGEESLEIEARLVYYPSENAPVKLLFFGLGNRKFVVSRIVSGQDIDRFGRKGSYLAHSFIFSAEDFTKVNCNPFIAFKLFKDKFHDSVLEVLQLIEPTETDIGSVALEVSEEGVGDLELELLQEAQKWDSEELKKLAHVAINALEMRKERKSLAFLGTPQDIQGALKAVFSLIPNELRLNCSFDTYSYGCNPVANYFWEFGYSLMPDNSQLFVLVNAGKRKVQIEMPSPVYPYERWLFTGISQRKFLDMVPHKVTAMQLHRFLLNEPSDQRLLESVPSAFLQDFFELNWPYVTAKLERNLKMSVGMTLVSRLRDWGLSQYQALGPKGFLFALQYGFDPAALANKLYAIFITQKPSRQEVAELEELAKKTKHDPLAARVAYWKQDHDELRRQMELLPEETCQEVVELLIREGYRPVANLLCPSRGKVIIKIFAQRAVFDLTLRDQIPQIIRALIALHQETLVTEFVPLFKELNLKQLKEVEREIEKRDQHMPKSFLKSLEEALASKEAEAKPRISLKGLFKKVSEKKQKEERGGRNGKF